MLLGYWAPDSQDDLSFQSLNSHAAGVDLFPRCLETVSVCWSFPPNQWLWGTICSFIQNLPPNWHCLRTNFCTCVLPYPTDIIWTWRVIQKGASLILHLSCTIPQSLCGQPHHASIKRFLMSCSKCLRPALPRLWAPWPCPKYTGVCTWKSLEHISVSSPLHRLLNAVRLDS